MLRSLPPSAVGKSEDTFTTLGCFGNVGFKEMQATPVVQADMFMTLSYYDTVEGDNVHLINSTNCEAEIPADTRVLLMKRGACTSFSFMTFPDYSDLERIGFGENTLSTQQYLTFNSEG